MTSDYVALHLLNTLLSLQSLSTFSPDSDHISICKLGRGMVPVRWWKQCKFLLKYYWLAKWRSCDRLIVWGNSRLLFGCFAYEVNFLYCKKGNLGPAKKIASTSTSSGNPNWVMWPRHGGSLKVGWSDAEASNMLYSFLGRLCNMKNSLLTNSGNVY